MKTTLLNLTKLICFSLAPSILHADETSSWCTSDITVLAETVAPKVTGFWAGTNGGGMLEIGDRKIILPAGNASNALIENGANGLSISSESLGGQSFPLIFVTDAAWTLDPSGDLLAPETQASMFGDDFNVTPLSNTEIEILADCPGNAIPKLYASGRVQGEEGPVDFELFLFVLDASRMYGVVKGALVAQGGVAKRITTFIR